MQSSVEYRPTSLDGLVGQERLVHLLRGQVKKKKLPQAMMFIGQKGNGKTTTARIIALAVQCKHQEKFGAPCKECRRDAKLFPIYELNCAKVRGVEDVENFIARADFDIIGRGKRKVFIFDEAHQMSSKAQDVLLKNFEEKGNNLYIICSTRPDKIIDTLRSRCRIYTLRPLDREGLEKLIKRLLLKANSELSIEALADALSDKSVTSPRLVANAVDAYVSGATAEEASDVEGTTSVESKALIRSTIKGDWSGVSKIIKDTPTADVRLLRAGVISYLRTVLLDSPDLDDRTKTIAKAIQRLAYVNQAEDSNQLSALAAELFMLCVMFQNYSL